MRYRQLFYRAAFFLFGIAPTVYTIGYLVERNVSTAAANGAAEASLPQIEAELASYLGVRVSLDSLRYEVDVRYKNEITRLTNVELHDPETDALLATADSVDLYMAAEGQLVIEPIGVTVHTTQLSRLAEVLHDRVLRELPAEAVIEAGCPSIQLVGGPREESLADVNLSIAHAAGKRIAQLTFRPAWDLQREPLRLEISRDTSSGSPITSLALHTGEEPLDAAWFGFCMPELSELGDSCTLTGGVLTATETDAGWETSVQGRFDQVALDRVVARSLRPYPLGTASISIDDARWRGGRLTQADGLIQASDLKLGWGFLIESLPVLRLRPEQPMLNPESLRQGTIVSNGNLYCRFSIRPAHLSLIGTQGFVLFQDGNPEPIPLYRHPDDKLPWSQQLLDLCRALGMPPVEFIPPEFDQRPGSVQLQRGT